MENKYLTAPSQIARRANREIPMLLKALLIATAAVTVSALAANADTVDPAQAIAQKFSEASDEKPAPPKKPMLSQRTYEEPGAGYEADMLDRARAEERERQSQEAPKRAAKPVDISPAPAPAPSVAAPVRPPMQLAAAPLAKLAALPSNPPIAEPQAPPPDVAAPTPATATILLVLDPDGAGIGFKPDPIICIDNRCWLSNGLGSPARAMNRNDAVTLQSTADLTADSCSGKSGCVYRNIPIDPATRIDVIEVGEGGGASAGAYTAAADQSCRKDGEALVCDNGLATQNFRIWLVPEATANAAGVTSLENAVAENLPAIDMSSANDK